MYQYFRFLLQITFKFKDPRVLYIFVPNKSFGQLLDTSAKYFMFLKTFNPELKNAKKSVTDALKTKLKKVIQKAAETTDDLIGNKIDKKIKKNSPQNNSETYS